MKNILFEYISAGERWRPRIRRMKGEIFAPQQARFIKAPGLHPDKELYIHSQLLSPAPAACISPVIYTSTRIKLLLSAREARTLERN